MLTTHDLGDIEDVCERIVIIDEGRIIYDGTIEAVKDGFARRPPAAPAVRRSRRALDAVAGRAARRRGRRAGDGADRVHRRVRPVRAHRRRRSSPRCSTAGEVVDFHLDEPAIEDVVRKVYAGDLQLAGDAAR